MNVGRRSMLVTPDQGERGAPSRRRVLFISYWVPPREAIGTIRSTHLLKHLPEFGWDVTTLTARFEEGRDRAQPEYVQTGYCDLKGVVKRVLGIGSRGTHEALRVHVPAYGTKRTPLQHAISLANTVVSYPDEYAGWLPFAVHAIRKTIAAHRFDLVLTTAPPATTNVAAALSHWPLPWIADLRDLWAEDDSAERSALRMRLDDTLERRCLSRAAALSASSDLSAKRFAQRYPGKPVFAISTGFDAQEWEHVPFASERPCTLLYAGTLYSGKRDPSTLFAALREILNENSARRDELRVDFYTSPEPWLLELVARFELEDVVRVLGFRERAEVLAAQRRADRLVVLSWDGPTAEGVVPGKLFEYFGARRPVLAIGGPLSSAVENLLRETNAGIRVRTVAQTKAEVLNALAEHRTGRQRTILDEAVRDYTGETCARRFAEMLDYVAGAVRSRDTSATAPIPANTEINGIVGK